ncbi:MAG: hypothetical protein ACRC1K_06480, partial [Planctomycetia bacterium]
MRTSALRLLVAPLFLGVVATAAAKESSEDFVEGMRRKGYADLAIDYLKSQLSTAKLDADQKASLEFEIATSLISASESLEDLSKREQMLEEARNSFNDWVMKYKTHTRRPEALMQVATIDLQRGRLRIVQAQLPSNAQRAEPLAAEARDFFAKSSKDYAEAAEKLDAEYKKFPVFIDDETKDGRAMRRLKTKMFAQAIEAEFQAALAQFYLADSYRTIELPPVDPADQKAVDARAKTKEAWKKEFEAQVAKAQGLFETIYKGHRRELIGLYGHLWFGRCIAAQGQYRPAMGIFQQLQEHENRDLAKFQREVFHFQILAFAAQKDSQQVVNLAKPWLADNVRSMGEQPYLGVQNELAHAYVQLGDAATNPSIKTRSYQDAGGLLDKLVATSNAYTGLAGRLKLKVDEVLNKDPNARTFQQLFGSASAKLDQIKPETAAAERAPILAEAIALLQKALRAAKPRDDQDAVNDCRLTLVFAYVTAQQTYEGAVLGESVAYNHPTSTAAPQAAYFAGEAYAMAYERA